MNDGEINEIALHGLFLFGVALAAVGWLCTVIFGVIWLSTVYNPLYASIITGMIGTITALGIPIYDIYG